MWRRIRVKYFHFSIWIFTYSCVIFWKDNPLIIELHCHLCKKKTKTKNNWLQMCGFISGLFILFCCSTCPFLCQYHATLIIVFVDVDVQSLSWLRLFATPWTAAGQASLSFIISQRSNSYSLSQICHPTISSSATIFSFCL